MLGCIPTGVRDATNLIIGDALDQHQAPGHDQGLDRVGKGMGLISPSDVGRCDKEDRDATVSRRRYQLVQRPVLEDEADEEHEDAERPEDGDGRYFAILAITDPQPPQQQHRQPVDGP